MRRLISGLMGRESGGIEEVLRGADDGQEILVLLGGVDEMRRVVGF
jgi:hypothetical protein